MSGRVIVLRANADRLPLPDASVHAVVCDPPYALAELPVKQVTEALAAWVSGNRGYVPAGSGGFMGRDWDKFVPPPAAWDEALRVLKPGGYLLAFAAPRTQDLMGMSIRLAGFEIRDGMKWIFGNGFPKGKGCLKPAHEPIIMARKAARVVSALPGLSGCRVGAGGQTRWAAPRGMGFSGGTDNGPSEALTSDVGRWPPNVLLSDDAAAELDRQSGITKSSGGTPMRRLGADSVDFRHASPAGANTGGLGDVGGASRFFPVFRYETKAGASERPRLPDGTAWPTVKPVALMRWLVRLVTPPGGIVGDFFCGTGPTGEAAVIEGFDAILADKDPEALALTRVRLAKPIQPAMDVSPETSPVPDIPKLPPVPGQDSLFDLPESAA